MATPYWVEVLHTTCEIFVTNLWKMAPFRKGNRSWIIVILKAYFCCLLCSFLLACVLNSIEGKDWLQNGYRGRRELPKAKGDTALDECIWFFVTTMHGIGFGEFMPHGHWGRMLAMFCCMMGYWFPIFMFSIILLSQLPGEREPTLISVSARVLSAVWPSYAVFVTIVASFGASLGPYISKDPYGPNQWATGIYYLWCVAHRMPYGDLWPGTAYGRLVTIPSAVLGLLYMPYALAVVAVRCPSKEQHESLLGYLNSRPEDALGRGYIVPRETVREFAGHGNQQELGVVSSAVESGLP